MEISDDVRLNEWLKKRWGHYSIEKDHDNKNPTSSKNQIKNLITLTVNKLQQNISVLEIEYNEMHFIIFFSDLVEKTLRSSTCREEEQM